MTLLLLLACTDPLALPDMASTPELAVSLDDGGAQIGTIHLSTARFGRQSLHTLTPTSLVDDDCAFRDQGGGCVAARGQVQNIEADRPGLREWWRVRPDGLQQGWVVDTPPTGAASAPLRIEVAVQGATVTRREDGDLILRDRAGRDWRYGGLAAWDAEGQPLNARMDPSEDGLWVSVEDTGATYPITVDPVLSTVWDAVSGTEDYGYFGWTMNAGFDLDGNGHPEILGYGINSAAYFGEALLYMGDASGYSSSPDVRFAGSVYAEGRGYLSAAGDVNGDGYDDLVLTTLVGRIEVYHGSVAGVSNTPDVTYTDPNSRGTFATALAVGDFDGDGRDDIVVGDPGSRSTDYGRLVFYFGDGTTTDPGGLSAGDRFASALDAADINGDGYDDLVIGAPGLDLAGTDAGGVYIAPGGSPYPSAVVAVFTNAPAGSELGTSVALVGDLNADGFQDFIGGAPLEDTNGTDAGAAYVYLGGSVGTWPAGTFAARLSGGIPNGRRGLAIGGAGDVNGDGYDDLIVGGDWYADDTFSLYAGAATGFVTTPEQSFLPYAAANIVGLGDVNRDGYDDLALSAPLSGSGTYISPGQIVVQLGYVDADRDGYGGGGGDTRDCDDDDARVNPAATEIAGDGVDQDCDGFELCYVDDDGDGYLPAGAATTSSANLACDGAGEADATAPTGDCAPTDGAIHPGAAELVGDGVDQDCDGVESCYVDADNDGVRASGGTVASVDSDCDDAGEAPSTDADGDCDDAAASVYPGAPEVVGDGMDQDCDGGEVCYLDADADGYRGNPASTMGSSDADCADPGEARTSLPAGDCDDADPARSPGRLELAGDGVDSDCNGAEICYVDDDEDGYLPAGRATTTSANVACDGGGEADATAPTGDCAPTDGAIHPGAAERVGDGVDQDCDGVESCYVDADNDGVRVSGGTVASVDGDCADAGEALSTDADGDCDDAAASVYPGAPEAVGDGVDQDCDGGEVCYLDTDADGYRGSTTVGSSDADCADPGEALTSLPAGDCDDADPARSPGRPELAGDGVDSDCNGAEICYVDADDDGVRPDLSTEVPSVDADCDDAGEATSAEPDGDCDDTLAAVNPDAAEIVGDGVDGDCDGSEICYAEADGDAYRSATEIPSADADCQDEGEALASAADGDCADGDPAVNPGATEVCDGVDNNCDDATDEGSAAPETWYRDADDDGFVDVDDSIDACEPPDGYGPEAAADCDDDDAAVRPDGDEVPGNGVDEDCDGEDAVLADGEKDEGGCGCDSSGGASWGIVGLGALALLRRRAGR